MLKLVYDDGRSPERAFEVRGDPLVVGRAAECEVCIPHKSLSRQHARIEAAEGVVAVTDLGSKNGTFVNGVRITRRALSPGDAVRLGDVVLAVVSGDVMTTAPSSSPSLGAPLQTTLLKNLTRVSIDELVGGPGAAGALRIAEVEAGRRAQKKLQVLLQVGRLLASPRGIDGVIDKILDETLSVLDVGRASVLLVDETTGALVPRVVKWAGAPLTVDDRGHDTAVISHVHKTGEAALVNPDAGATRSLMCVPLQANDKIIGVLYVDSSGGERRFSEEDLEFLAAFATQAAIVIENSLLYARIEVETVSRMQQVMEAKLSALGAVVAGIAHEIKNPLNFINNFADLSTSLAAELRAGLDGQKEHCEPAAFDEIGETLQMLGDNVGKIGEHGRRAASIIDRMLSHARGRSAVREEVSLNTVLERSLRLAVGPRDSDFPLEIDVRYDDSLAPFEMVQQDIARVFINIVENACYAMRQKRDAQGGDYAPRLTVRTADRGARAEVRIHDNGTGIAPEVAPRIFDPFFTTKPPGKGTGLGLSLSYDIVVQGHQGTLDVRTEQGQFTELVLTLPKPHRAAAEA